MEDERLSAQQAVLQSRELSLDMVEADDWKTRRKIDRNALAKLRKLSAANAKPVVFRRNDGAFEAGFLLDKIENSQRLLMVGSTWKIVRARKSAIIIPVKVSPEKFEEILDAQTLARRLIAELLKCTKQRKTSTNRRSKKQTARSG